MWKINPKLKVLTLNCPIDFSRCTKDSFYPLIGFSLQITASKGLVNQFKQYILVVPALTHHWEVGKWGVLASLLERCSCVLIQSQVPSVGTWVLVWVTEHRAGSPPWWPQHQSEPWCPTVHKEVTHLGGLIQCWGGCGNLFLPSFQVCLLECEGRVSSSLTWEVCQNVMKVPRLPTPSGGGVASSRTGEELGLTSFELLESAAAESFQDGDQDEATFEQRSAQYDSALLGSSEEGEEMQGRHEERQPREERNVEVNSPITRDQDEIPEALALSKRFGGFQRGRHGYRKLIGSPMRPLQKRYGGFIGVRKSARKWNSQKRVNQLLKQYLDIRRSRSGRFNIPMTRLRM